MSDSSLIQKLHKEITGNRKKAAILGVLLLIGLSIWIPQIGRLLSGPGEFAVSPPPASTSPAPATSAGTSPALSTNESLSWHQLADWIERGDYLHPVAPATGISNPFGSSPTKPDVAIVPIIDPEPPVVEQPPPQPVKKELLPAPSQLVLRSTLQGKTTRGAVINDQYYREGDTLESNETSYTLSHVEARRVILKSGDQYFELLIPSVLPRTDYSLPSSPSTPPSDSL